MRFPRFWLALVACFVCFSSLAGTDAPIVIKLSHAGAAGTPRGLAAERFRDLAESRTNGAVKVEIYPDSTLLPEANEIDALTSGAVQLSVISTTRFAGIGIPDFEVLDLPFVTPNTRSFHKLSCGAIGREMLKTLETRGLTGLAMWDGGFRVLTTNRRIRNVADLRGLKVRSHVSKTMQSYLESLGMRPQWVPLNELSQALQNGSIDAVDTIISNVWTKKLMEQQQYAVLLRDTHQAYVLAANKKFWDNLPTETRDALEEVVRITKTYADALAEVENRIGANKIRNSGKMEVVAPDAEQIQSLKRAALPVYRATALRLGRERIEAVLKLSGQTMPE